MCEVRGSKRRKQRDPRQLFLSEEALVLYPLHISTGHGVLWFELWGCVCSCAEMTAWRQTWEDDSHAQSALKPSMRWVFPLLLAIPYTPFPWSVQLLKVSQFAEGPSCCPSCNSRIYLDFIALPLIDLGHLSHGPVCVSGFGYSAPVCRFVVVEFFTLAN